jgi:hypothetical protein
MPFNQGDLVKSISQPEVYLIDSGQRRWIPDPSTLLSISTWEKVKVTTDAEINVIPVGAPIPSVLGLRRWPDGSLLKSSLPPVYIVENGTRRWIPDPETFNALGLVWERINVISNTELNLIPLGEQLPHTQRISVPLFTDLKYNHYMESTANLLTGSGKLSVQTRIWTLTWFGGFKGVVSVFGSDSNDQITFQAVNRFGVDGTAIGQSDRTIAWSEEIDTTAASRTVKITITHTPGENVSWERILRELQKAGPLVDVIAGAFKSGGSSASSS